MPKNTELWNEVEDKLKSLTSSLQSLPSDMREKALHFITKEISPDETSRSLVKDTATSNVSDAQGTPIKVLPKKRVQPSENGRNDETTAALPSSSSIIEPKKRGRPRLNRSLETVESETEIQVPKKRGRPPKSATLSTSLNTHEEEVAKTTTNEVLPRSSSRVRRKPKTYIEEDENLFNDHVQKDGNGSVILVPVDENDLSDAINHVASSLNDDDDDTDENYDYNEESLKEKKKRSRKVASKSSTSESDNAEEKQSKLSHVKKRGRPRKNDLEARKESEVDPDFLSDTSRKKTIGRPRFSSYVLGYVPKPKLYNCTECGKNLSSSASLKEHIRRHTGDLYMCDLCGQKFSTNSGFYSVGRRKILKDKSFPRSK